MESSTVLRADGCPPVDPDAEPAFLTAVLRVAPAAGERILAVTAPSALVAPDGLVYPAWSLHSTVADASALQHDPERVGAGVMAAAVASRGLGPITARALGLDAHGCSTVLVLEPGPGMIALRQALASRWDVLRTGWHVTLARHRSPAPATLVAAATGLPVDGLEVVFDRLDLVFTNKCMAEGATTVLVSVPLPG